MSEPENPKRNSQEGEKQDRGEKRGKHTVGELHEPGERAVVQAVFLRGEEGAQLLLAHVVFGEGDILAADETAAGGLVNGPGEVGGGQDEHAGGVAVG